MKNVYWVYILRCNDNSLYTGIARDIEKRYLQHLNKTAKCKFTRRKDKHPLQLAQCWKVHGNRGDATKIELFIKKRDKRIKEEFINYPHKLKDFVSDINSDLDIEAYGIEEIHSKVKSTLSLF